MNAPTKVAQATAVPPFAVPQYMCKGSNGPHVTPLQSFLCGAGYGQGVVFDEKYGKVTAERVAAFQKAIGLEVDGNFGPKTRVAAKLAHNFDFAAACQATPGMTDFVQPDGKVISWWRDPSESSRDEINISRILAIA